MATLAVEEALQRILEGVEPTPLETVAIEGARGRTLGAPLAVCTT